jgi:hypothetical protein
MEQPPPSPYAPPRCAPALPWRHDLRISIRQADTGHAQHAYARSIGKRATIKLDGEHQNHCITADDQCGMVVRYVMPLRVDKDRGQLVDEVCHGKVEIEFHDEMVL